MFEYLFVEINSSVLNYPEEIENYAKQGWRFVQIVTSLSSDSRNRKYLELIFEKPL